MKSGSHIKNQKVQTMAADQIKAHSNAQISIIIPTFNNLELTRQCLAAIRKTAGSVLYEIIVVDNGSTDGTPGYLLKEQAAGQLRTIVNKINLGFAKACNQGADAAFSDYLLFLNNDIEPTAGWIEPLINILDADRSVAAVGSKLLFPDGTIQHAGLLIIDDRKLPDPLVARHIYYKHSSSLPKANQPLTYQALTAACLLVNKSAFKEAGGFDEGYWNGYEDIDLCFKLQQRGWNLVYQPESTLIHYESQSGSERFKKVQHNIHRLHQKWLGKIKPDVIIEKDGSMRVTDAGKIHPYALPATSHAITPLTPSEEMHNLVSIIILTLNQWHQTELCLNSIARHTPEPHEIIVVDNGSTDETPSRLRKLLKPGPNIRVIANRTNRGFATGNNQGISIAKGEYILLLNNDTIVTPGWLGRMLDVFNRHPETGIVGPMSNYVSGPQLVSEADYKMNEEIDAFAEQWSREHTGQSFPIYLVVGFCLLTKREVIDRIGGLDEQFGSGNFEDDDFCIRAALSGFKARVAQDVFIHHTGSQTFKSAGIDYNKSLMRNWELFKTKWGIPMNTPDGKGYQLPRHIPSHLSLAVPLPDLASDHHPDADKRWWQDAGFKKGKKHKPTETKDLQNALELAVRHHQAGNLSQAENICRKILKADPNNFYALHILGMVYYQLKQYDLSIVYNRKALNINADIPKAYYYLGNALSAKGQLDEAIPCYRKAIQIDPTFIDAYFHIGNTFGKKGQHDDAITCYKKALQLNPLFFDAQYKLGNVYRAKGQHDDAITCYKKALQLNPNFFAAYYNLGNTLQEKDQLDDAITCYKKALMAKSDFAEAISELVHLLRQTCNWQELEAMTAILDSFIKKALDMKTKPPESPFHCVIRRSDLSMNFAIAKAWSADIARSVSSVKIHFPFDERKSGKRKLVIGYLSNDFYNHPTAHLMLSLFGLHNRDEFTIACYSYGKDDGTGYRERIMHDCDKFVDIMSFSYTDAAQRIHEDQVDILVDLKGYTRGYRLAICALRPAPVQVSYLGFPGTTGADFIDYIITDRIVTPEDNTPYFSEKFVYLPHCYQVNDHTQPISNRAWTKEEFGIPESGFVFCSFNSSYKIDPVMFDVWMRILQKVPESVLWLLFSNKTAQQNLGREAEARGITSERLIFAEKLLKADHLSRLRCADLALDTRIVNGHTTTSDALWAGVPVITLQGSHFASRVSSSVLTAIGLPELITHSLEEYEARAVQLARNPSEQQEIRERLAKNRLTAPLFDTPRFVRNLETAYKEMWKIFLSGESPRQISVRGNGMRNAE